MSSIKSYQQARVTKDKNFDGKFYFAVKTTGVFCRPSCPSPIAKEHNVEYFTSIFSALNKGYRPCYRCRPDLNVDYYNSNIDGSKIVSEALKLIYDGYLNFNSVVDLAKKFYISDRQLRKLFNQNIGLPPVKVALYHRAIFAKKLLSNSQLSITNIAFAAGFGSIRQFNAVYKNIFGVTPTDTKNKTSSSNVPQNNVLYLKYQKPFDFNQILSYLKLRAISGVEQVTNNSYSRTFRLNNIKGYFTVTNNPAKSALELKIVTDNIKVYMPIVNKVKRLFDLYTNFSVIRSIFSKDPILKQGLINNQIPNLPVSINAYEVVIRAILGQQITVKAATTLAGRLVKKVNITTTNYPNSLSHFFPKPQELLTTDITNIGLTKTRQQTLMAATQALIKGVFTLEMSQPYNQFINEFTSVKGIGNWTANYVAMRALAMVDAFPASDLWVIKALSPSQHKLSQKQILQIAEKWRPYRAYATLCLWNYASKMEE
ncbi:DNA-3-methyladenine glycosylase 2 family protein [Clostridium sp. 'deep sea']|uniref:DNA-3-methyladenine glycosylase 2 family protein n=1 Tax=Clostridium sp. 'deep sea' TaxID=2779445 RepID=UPI00189661AA|nr:AlkA N-terminal domain-containing protein [Clostridium sp. 'deep sea']QOR35035.1 DNA-3-methyladenine glycosylase 2 family protein [Clostridium sp. 'deep sea']